MQSRRADQPKAPGPVANPLEQLPSSAVLKGAMERIAQKKKRPRPQKRIAPAIAAALKSKEEKMKADPEDYESSDESDYDPSDEEGIGGYKPGGYHPVRLGEIFNKRYRVLKKLGWGHFSTVWLCLDMQTNNNVAMKIVKSVSHYTEAALDEIELLKVITARDPQRKKHVIHLVDFFEHKGPHGDHVCMVFPALGPNLLDLIKKFDSKGLPIPIVKVLCKQILIALDYIHRECQLIHTDLKPENILLSAAWNVSELPAWAKNSFKNAARKAAADPVTWTPGSELAPGGFIPGVAGTFKPGTALPVAPAVGAAPATPPPASGAEDDDDDDADSESLDPAVKKKRDKNKKKRAKAREKKAAQKAAAANVHPDVLAELGVSAPPSSSAAAPAAAAAPAKPAAALPTSQLQNLSLLPVQPLSVASIGAAQSAQNAAAAAAAAAAAPSAPAAAHANGSAEQLKPAEIPLAVHSPMALANKDEDKLAAAEKTTTSSAATPMQVSSAATEPAKEAAKESEAPKELAKQEAKEAPKEAKDEGMTVEEALQRIRPDVRDAILQRRCTFYVTGKNFEAQPYLECRDCKDVVMCIPCMNKCHTHGLMKWHRVSKELKLGRLYCDCGVNGPKECRAMPKATASGYVPLKSDGGAKHNSLVFDPKLQSVNVVDFGNACFVHKHFTETIQTREYRAPEAIIYSGYDTSCDIWSMGCMVFEFLTGDLLFEPRSGENYSKSDDHLAQMVELLGKPPKGFAMSGKLSKEYFKPNGDLKYINEYNFWPLERVLAEKYKFHKKDAEEAAAFIKPMLTWIPQKRAADLLKHPWLADIDENSPTVWESIKNPLLAREREKEYKAALNAADPAGAAKSSKEKEKEKEREKEKEAAPAPAAETPAAAATDAGKQ